MPQIEKVITASKASHKKARLANMIFTASLCKGLWRLPHDLPMWGNYRMLFAAVSTTRPTLIKCDGAVGSIRLLVYWSIQMHPQIGLFNPRSGM